MVAPDHRQRPQAPAGRRVPPRREPHPPLQAPSRRRHYSPRASTPAETRILLLDHDTKFTTSFDAVFEADDCEVKRVGPAAPNLNATGERWVQSAKTECR